MTNGFEIVVLPRKTMTWEEFVQTTPPRSIALDGVVHAEPKFDEATLHQNFDHHHGVVREATMSTAMQVYYAIKGGLMQTFGTDPHTPCRIYINDTDQDTAFAVWLLLNYKQFVGTKSVPHINRLLELNNRWDITGGAFPMDLSDALVRQHNWVFQPYTELRKSGGLANAGEAELRNNLEATIGRLSQYLMGQGGELELDTRHDILFDHPRFKIVYEIGGNDARYYLYSKGMDAFISLVATRPNGRFVYSVGRRSRYIPFPLTKLYQAFNEAEGAPDNAQWGGSDIIGGSPRSTYSALTWEQLRDITLGVLS